MEIQDPEKGDVPDAVDTKSGSIVISEQVARSGSKTWFRALLSLLEIETHGIEPIPAERRTDTRLYEMFFVWFSANLNVLAFSTGTVGPTVFGLGLKDSFAVIVIVDLAFLIPAYFGVFGPKLGTRVMVQSRFSFGYLGSIIPSVLNVFTLQGFLVLNSIIGGQTLASVSKTLSWNVGIVIIAVISLFITFCGYRVVHWYESVAWIPNVITFIVMLGIGGKQLSKAPLSTNPGIASIVSFASTLASTDISWCTMVSDYGIYHRADASSWRISIYTYLGFMLSSVVLHCIGAAFACAAPFVPEWSAGYAGGSNVGGLLEAILSPSGGFGKFLTVLVALSVPSACAPTMYSFGASFMNVAPFFAKVPRNAYAVVSTAILIPVAIVGSTHFYSTFVDLFSIIGYWTASFSAIVLTEHVVFRRCSFRLYPVSAWAVPRALPLGLAAVLAFFGSFGIIVPCMSQAWYEGPIASAGTGDIGIFVAIAATAPLYAALRTIELKVRNDVSKEQVAGGAFFFSFLKSLHT
ncbi:cytosine-purine permease [Phellopilus nigrolimitatus]|nr:cytosine-purine permease [Phellopilus nigrolimitatus]